MSAKPSPRKPSSPTSSTVHIALVIMVLALGFTLRLIQPTLVEFKRDEATVARLGQAIAYEGYRPAVGVDSSLGIDNLPLTLYLVALPLRIWSDPLSAVVFTALLNSMALVGCYALARAAFGRRAAVLSTLLFAVSPWAVLYARKIWARTLPLFTVVFIGSLFLTFVRRRQWALVPAFVSLAALIGLQLEALAFAPLLAVSLLLYRREVAWRPLLAGILLFGLLFLPYAIHDMRHDWENARGLLSYAGGTSVFSWDAVRYAFELVGSRGIAGQTGPLHRMFRQSLRPLWWLNGILDVSLIAALGYAGHQIVWCATQARRRVFMLLVLWFALPIALQLRTSSPTQPHYFVTLYPAPYLLIAVPAAEIWGRLRPSINSTRRAIASTLRAASIALLVLFVGWQVAVTAQLRAYMVDHPSTGGYGIPLRYTRQAAHRAADAAQDGQIIVLSENPAPFLAETPTVFDALLFRTPHRFADPRAALPFPDENRVVYLTGPRQDRSGDPSATWAGAAMRRLAQLPSAEQLPGVALADGTTYEIYLWENEDRAELLDGMTPLGGGIPFANGVVFAAYEIQNGDQEADRLAVRLAWWLQAGTAGDADYHFTVQLLDGEGRPVGQDDHAGFPAAYWRQGDLVLNHFTLPMREDLPDGVYRLRAGMYTYPEIQGVPVVDVDGQAIDDGVTLQEIIR